MIEPRIVDQRDGPKIEGTRITVYTILEYVHAGRTRDRIAAILNLSSQQVGTAIDYIHDHSMEVDAEYQKIQARISKGNPASVEEQLQANRDKLRLRLSQKKAPSE